MSLSGAEGEWQLSSIVGLNRHKLRQGLVGMAVSCLKTRAPRAESHISSTTEGTAMTSGHTVLTGPRVLRT